LQRAFFEKNATTFAHTAIGFSLKKWKRDDDDGNKKRIF